MDDAEELYQRRIASRFAALDQEGSGYISREDFTTAAGRLLAEFGVPHRSDRGQALAYGAEAFWQGLAGIADVDGDQRVSHEEFAHGAVKRLHDNPDRFAEIARPFVRAVLALTDDGGGGTGTAGLERALRVLGVPGGTAAQAAASLDARADGRVAEEDAVAALARYFMLP
ncbi:calcium-binding protein [Streptomyces sp. CC53]|uniref:EF-hand domain-containing protein n=1 Tax=unclassified Streptomyces TaxID=2593676 RepID=UPI0008DEA282|nr:MULTISPECIES: EF-hand domain-containing protein [unclassified Streptomyces]OII66063.1 calcium-binding protein [Streptomyces sp. CC53]OII68070.1 calcium-binding protein [Streptomyces sp. CC77]